MNLRYALSTKGWVAVGLIVYFLATFAISTGESLLAIAAFNTAGVTAFDSTKSKESRSS